MSEPYLIASTPAHKGLEPIIDKARKYLGGSSVTLVPSGHYHEVHTGRGKTAFRVVPSGNRWRLEGGHDDTAPAKAQGGAA